MEILLCPTCGSITRTGEVSCTKCGGTLSRFAASPVGLSAVGADRNYQPQTISVSGDPMVLERIICGQRVLKLLNGIHEASATQLVGADNGNGQKHVISGNGDGDLANDSPDTSASAVDLPAASTPSVTSPTPSVTSLTPSDFDFFAQNSPPAYPSSNAVSPDHDISIGHEQLPTDKRADTSGGEFFSKTTEADAAAASFNALVTDAISSDAMVSAVQPDMVPDNTSAAPIDTAAKESAITIERQSEKPVSRDAASQGTHNKPASTSSGTGANASTTAPIFGRITSFLENGVEIAGRRRSVSSLVVASAIIFFVSALIFNGAGSLLSGLGGLNLPWLQGQSGPPLAGEWDINYVFRNQLFQGRMIVQQSGSQLTGYGQDPGYFEFAGNENGDQVHITKVYMDPGNKRRIGFPVTLDGVIREWGSGRLNMHGVYVTSTKQGVFLHARVEPVQGNWQADLVSTAVANSSAAPRLDSTNNLIPNPSQTQDFQGLLMKVAGGFLLVGFAIILGSLKLFGPNGMVNIWTKKEYIPSQFKSYHDKMMWELAKPITAGSVPLGERLDWNLLQFYKPKRLAIPPDLRRTNPHILVLGGGDKGKTRLMANMIIHDIQDNDRAVVVIDSDGGLVDLITRWIASQPEGRKYAERLVLVDPTHKNTVCPAYNPLEMPEDGDLQAAASAIVFGFKAIYTESPGQQSQWNQQTANILRNAALLLMANNKTLTDLPVVLSDNDFRDVLLDNIEKHKHEKVEYITLLETWNQYKRLARTEQWINWVEPILNRVSPMLSDPRIRSILTKPKGDLNLRDVIREGKTLLVKVPHGHLDQNADLLGGLIVTGLKQAALSLAGPGRNTNKHNCALYLDEFDKFIEKETFEGITHETHKFQIGLICAAQTLQHLPEDFRNQLSINVGTICAFSLGKKDADMLGPQMFRVDGRKIKHQTLQNIFNRVNSSFHFELISDEEKLNIDRVIGQDERTYFCYRVGTVAGVFHLKAFEFKDISDEHVDWDLIDTWYTSDNVQHAATNG